MSNKLTPEIIAEIKSKNSGELRVVKSDLADLVFRAPTRGEYDRWRDQSLTDKSKQSIYDRELACSCIVWPSQEVFKDVIDTKPAMLGVEIISAITGMAGLADTFPIEKL